MGLFKVTENLFVGIGNPDLYRGKIEEHGIKTVVIVPHSPEDCASNMWHNFRKDGFEFYMSHIVINDEDFVITKIKPIVDFVISDMVRYNGSAVVICRYKNDGCVHKLITSILSGLTLQEKHILYIMGDSKEV